MNNKLLGQRIKFIRKELGLTMEEFGELFSPSASDSIVSRWESGKSLPNNNRLKRIAELGNTTVEKLSQSGIVCPVCKNENILPEHNYCFICGTKIQKEPASSANDTSH